MGCEEGFFVANPPVALSEGDGDRAGAGTNKSLFIEHDMQIAAIHKRTFGPLINCIEHAKHLCAHKCIIPINQHNNLALFTMPMNRIIDIFQGKHIFLVDNDLDLALWDAFFLYISFDVVAGAVRGVVVDVDYVVVGVVLHEEGVQVAKV